MEPSPGPFARITNTKGQAKRFKPRDEPNSSDEEAAIRILPKGRRFVA
jgi:hypothetical protein